jgi:hypothetical protein
MQASQDEFISVAQAQTLLGVSKNSMTRIIRVAQLWVGKDLVDRRIRLLKRSEVEALAAQTAARKKAA